MFHNKLQLNTDKREFITIASPFKQRRIIVSQLDLESDIILASKTVLNLGVMMANT